MECQDTDENLMLRYQTGEEAAFSELYRRYHRRLFGYLRHHALSETAINEVFQNIWMKLHQSRLNYEKRFKFSAWLFTISRSTMIDFWRKERNSSKLRPLDEASTVSMEAESQEILAQEPGLPWEDISTQDKQALEWRYLEEVDFEEIGRRLGLSPVSARQRISRALKKLRQGILKRKL